MSAKILIIDDEPSARQTLENQLLPEGYSLQFAVDGMDGLAQAQAWQPDVILCDVMMPKMDGFEFCQQIRANTELGQVPIILLTALNDRQAKLNGLQAGADEFISKPIDAYELRARLRTLTRLDRFRKLYDEHIKLENAHNELLQTYEKLHTSEERFHGFIEQSSDGFLLTDEQGLIIEWNPALTRILGLTREQALGRALWDIQAQINPSKEQSLVNPDFLKNAIQAMLKDDDTSLLGKLNSQEVQTIHGERKFVQQNSFAVHTAKGIRLGAVLRDVTEHKRAEENLRQTETRYRALIENAPDGIVLVSADGRFKYASPSIERLFGYNQEDIARGDPAKMTHPDDLPMVLTELAAVIEKPAYIPTLQYRFLHKNGEWRWIESRFNNLLASPNVEAIIINFRDIHERKLAEKALGKSEALLAEALQVGRIGYWEWTPPGSNLICSDELLEIFAMPKDHKFIPQDEINRLISPQDLERVHQMDRQALATHTNMEYEFRIQIPGGRRLWVHQHTRVTYSPEGQPIRILGIIQDITVRKEADEKLRESEERFRALFESSNAIMMLLEPDTGQIVDANLAAATFYGYSHEQLVSMNINEINQLPATQVVEERQRAKREQRNYFVFPHRLADGQIRTVEVRSHPIVSESQTLLFSIIYDITENVQSQKELRESQLRMEMALKGANAATWDWNVQSGETVFNERWAEIIGYSLQELEPVSIQTWINLCHPDDLKRSDELLQKHFSGEADFYECEARMKHKNGSWVWVIDRGKVMEWDIDGKPLRMFGTHLDITERKREESYTQARLRLANLSFEAINLDTLMRYMLDEAEMLTDSQIGFFHFVDDDQNTISLQTWSTNTLATLCTAEGKGQHYPVAQAGVWANGIRDGQAHIYNDYASIPNRLGIPEGHAPVTRFISLPIIRNNKIVAALGVGNKPRDYDEHDLEIVQRLAEEAFDIILRKRAEQELQESEEKYRSLLESLDSVVTTVDADGTFLYMNDTAAEQMGSTAAQLIGKTMYELFPQQIAARQMENIKSVIASNQGRFSEAITMVRGQPRWYRTFIQPLHDDTGKVTSVLINSTDIHEIKETQQQLEELNRTLEERVKERTGQVQDLYDNAPVGYHSLNINRQFIAINQTELKMLGYTREELLGQTNTIAFTPESTPILVENFQRLLAEGRVVDMQVVAKRKDGTTFPVTINAVATYDENGQFVSSRSTMIDITERRRAEEAMRHANIELARAMRMKDEFLANMSHELRTPLNGILGLSEALELETYGALGEKQIRAIKNIESSGRHLLSLINDILDLSKIEAGKLEIHIEPVSVTDICQASLAFIKEPSAKKGVAVEFKPDPLASTVPADPRRLKQILVNLLSNAVKFTPADGKIALKVEANVQKQFLNFSVIDTGIGIAPEDLSRLFNPFTQVDSSLTRQHEGTGLGLALVKELTEMHGGSVRVSSDVGKGSTFTISIPWQPDVTPQGSFSANEQAGTGQSAAQETRKKLETILLAEDVESNIMIIGDFLESQGYNLIYAVNGHEAIEKARAHVPALILMDVQMPGMDGLEAIRRLRIDPRFTAVPIIALTAMAMVGDRERCLAAGANEYMSKPVGLKRLAEMISSLLGNK